MQQKPCCCCIGFWPCPIRTHAAMPLSQLVEAGYRVRAVVRDATLPGARSLLAAANKDFEFQQGPGQCRLTEGHILQLDSIAQAVRGSTHIFHCASPFIADASDIQSEELQKGRGTCFHCPPEPAVDETRCQFPL
eukprot:1161387-Pelagomonas_calceolata.AAC.9